MEFFMIIFLSVMFSAILVLLVHPRLVKIARIKSIVDNPNARKLNKEPIPILGGVGVFFGIFITVGLFYFHYDCSSLFIVFIAILLMLFTGVADDILNLSPRIKFLLQIVAVCFLIAEGYLLDDLHGLYGIHYLPMGVAYPLTLIACVGVINAMNLIDGVDGLASGYGIIVATICGIVFLQYGDIPYAILAWALVGALFPFFMHNVFGRKYKMFIGDGGSLVLGVIFSAFMLNILQYEGSNSLGTYSVSFLMAVLAIPVFDTVRVMLIRIAKKRSPFSADKTHLHHMFIQLGFSHVLTTLQIILLNVFVIVLWYITALVWHISPEIQFLIIFLACLMVTYGIWHIVSYLEKYRPLLYNRLQQHIKLHYPQRNKFFLKIQRQLDRL
ncbi:hypothetical protein HMPREF9449_03039 [Odoribacter laneus YIT 12061]|uniref:Uncharacterized protein n=2 Tax=Odoribacter laneus TaxID=626933 RepID=H1DLA3_9BACT|nr:hypothetical protein HMPREF9449_03039 [Odoribacter laneus YIT 12061]